MTALSAITTQYNQDAVIIIDKENRVCCIEKSKYDNKGNWTGKMIVISENKNAFYLLGYGVNSSEYQKTLNLTEKEKNEYIQLVQNF